MGFNLKQLFSLITSPGWRTEEYTDSELDEILKARDEEAAQQQAQNANSWEEEPATDDSGWVADPGLGLNDTMPTWSQPDDSGSDVYSNTGLNDFTSQEVPLDTQVYADYVQRLKDEAVGKTNDKSQAQSTEEGPEAFLNAVGSSYDDLVNHGEGYVPTAPVQSDGVSVLDRIGLGLKSSGQKAAADTYMLADTYNRNNDDRDALIKKLLDMGADPEGYRLALMAQGSGGVKREIQRWIDDESKRLGVTSTTTPLTAQNSQGMRKMAQARQTRAQVSEGLSDEGVGIFTPKKIADTIVGAGQTLAVLPSALISPALPALVLGADAAANKEYDLSLQGKSAKDAQDRGIISGVIVGATAAIPMGKLSEMLATDVGKNALIEILKQAGYGGAQAAATYVLNFAADKAVKDPNAEFNIYELIDDALGGAEAGAFMAGTGIGIKKAANFLLKGGANTQFNSPESVAKAQGTAFDETPPDTAASDARQTSEQPMNGQTYDFTDADAYKRKLEKDAAKSVAENGDLGYTGNQQETGSAKGAGNKAGIPKIQVDEILKTPKYSRPDPATYLKKEYITSHTTQFKDGVTKISYQAPSGYAGPPGGTFVMPTSIADDLIARVGGDISELERLLGLDPGELGTNPVRIDIANPSGLRMPSGNEKGANFKWIPGGYTSGGIPEIIIDSPSPEQYIVRPIK